MFDTHLHTKFSTDSKMKIFEVIDTIKSNNIRAIVTEHMDLNFKYPKDFRFNPEEYFKEYSPYRSKNLLMGIEIGMCNKFSKDYEKIVSNYPFDYIIGSIHDINDKDLFLDSYYYEIKSKKEVYEEYFLSMINSIDSHPFINSLGHIDYISRYAKYEDSEIYYEEYRDLIDAILKKLVDKGICIELNTRRIENEKTRENFIKIYKRYYELGGKYVTLGSDAHTKEDIGCNLKLGREIVDYCNLKEVYFVNRNMEFV